jgi:putative ABC transport system permease protein
LPGDLRIDAMRRVPLVVRALRWRAGASLSLLAVATMTVFAASVGPLYLLTAQNTVLHATLAQVGPSQDGITALTQLPAVTSGSAAQAMIPVARDYHLGRWYQRPVITVDAGVKFARTHQPAGAPRFFDADLVSRTGVCAHLSLAAGRCPIGIDQVAITQRTAYAIGAHIGSEIYPEGLGGLTVVGIVRVGDPTLPYWWGDNYFDFAPAVLRPSPLPSTPAQLDALWTVPASLYGLPGTATAQITLNQGRTRAASLQQLVYALANFEYVARREYGMLVSTGLIGELNEYGQQTNLMAAVLAVVDLQLVLLAVLVLYALSLRLADGRQKEVALGQLHGLRATSVLAVGLLEPLVVALCALPLGLALGWLALEGASGVLLNGDPVTLAPLVFWAALAAFLGSALAVAAGAHRIMSRHLVDELRGGEPRTSGASLAAVDAAVLAFAVFGLVALFASGLIHSGKVDPVAIFAPGLLALAVAVCAVRFLPWPGRWLLRRRRGTTAVAVGLASRQLLRRPATLRQIVVLTVATALACFAINCWAVAGANRTLRADFEIGAARVLQVRVPNSVMLLYAVRRADPSGRYAMAVMEMRSQSQNLLAVDASRLMRVAYWPGSISRTKRAKIVAWLTSRTPDALLVSGSEVRMTVDLAGSPPTPPDLQFDLMDGGNYPAVADFGYLSDGTHSYTATLPAACRGGCRVTQLVPYWTAPPGGQQQTTYSLRLSSIQNLTNGVWRSVQAPTAKANYWQASSPAVEVTRAAGQIALRFHDASSDVLTPAAIPAPLPTVIPAVVTTSSQVGDPGAAGLLDFDGTLLEANTKIEVRGLPSLGQYGFLLDLPLAVQAEVSQPIDTTDYVWLSAGAPKRVIGALRAQGVTVIRSVTPRPLLRVYDHTALALSYDFFLFAAAAAAALAMAALTVSAVIGARRRSSELASLLVAGVSRRTLVAALVAEQLMLVMPAVALGLVAGEVGTWLTLPSLPEFIGGAGAPPLDLALPFLPLFALALTLLILLSASALVAAWVSIHEAQLDRLRFLAT